mmetsp:Transcript_22125/g.56650  ORF Transcript_22125/g.56650 Transcript_22125/m.56650 type:complete len:215 (-) Transcript_22125:1662-2306(-)
MGAPAICALVKALARIARDPPWLAAAVRFRTGRTRAHRSILPQPLARRQELRRGPGWLLDAGRESQVRGLGGQRLPVVHDRAPVLGAWGCRARAGLGARRCRARGARAAPRLAAGQAGAALLRHLQVPLPPTPHRPSALRAAHRDARGTALLQLGAPPVRWAVRPVHRPLQDRRVATLQAILCALRPAARHRRVALRIGLCGAPRHLQGNHDPR